MYRCGVTRMAGACRHVCQNCGRLFSLPASSPSGHLFLRTLPFSARPPHLALTKEEIAFLPQFRCPSPVMVISYPEKECDYEREIEALTRSSVVGFDVEMRPRFTTHSTIVVPSLVQVASREGCVMWRLKRQGKQAVSSVSFPPLLREILESRTIMKVGHSSSSDASHLLRHYHVNTSNIFDTYEFSLTLDLNLLSLRGLVGIFFGQRLSKSMARSNWERQMLTPAQVHYAAADAWASLEVYYALLRYAAEQGVIPPPAIESALNLLKPSEAVIVEEELRKVSFQIGAARGAKRDAARCTCTAKQPAGLKRNKRETVESLPEFTQVEPVSELPQAKGPPSTQFWKKWLQWFHR